MTTRFAKLQEMLLLYRKKRSITKSPSKLIMTNLIHSPYSLSWVLQISGSVYLRWKMAQTLVKQEGLVWMETWQQLARQPAIPTPGARNWMPGSLCQAAMLSPHPNRSKVQRLGCRPRQWQLQPLRWLQPQTMMISFKINGKLLLCHIHQVTWQRLLMELTLVTPSVVSASV